MSEVLIAHDDVSELHEFFQACADGAKQTCVDNGISYRSILPPNLTEGNVIEAMLGHQLCLIAAHGDSDGIYNESGQGVISISTTNYNFKNKGLYSIACSCAQNLHPHLQGVGLQFFVGYNGPFTSRGDLEPFVISAMSGLKSILSGDSLNVAKAKMLKSFDEQIEILDAKDPLAASDLLHNKEALVFEGDEIFVETFLNSLKTKRD